MPLIFSHRGVRFFFFSNEGSPREPVHVHVRKGPLIAKFWVEPAVQLADNFGFTASELNKIAEIIHTRRNEILRAWNEHFE